MELQWPAAKEKETGGGDKMKGRVDAARERESACVI